ncbi:HK97 gp10 family phage protein [Peptostreptococcus equinus]|uniref:HK97 gp10 family phage protein n=1 Tax=Peptostreptococcus equinus TaxID=3003601 RepID=A0ABY7JU86_9FIRM|nr:HK97 gp10 family phage protein [Peptostreptococcus sp. CBA3647]WAW15452.1 HK97 gp10 family phage protein [Peptostreptococcus sp. CBA3647]
MASIRGKADFSELKKFERQLKKMEKTENDKFLRDLCRELAAITLSKAIFLTPVVSGDLRRGWTGGVAIDAKDYIAKKNVRKTGNTYGITLKNDMFYASYVNYGHSQKVGRYVPAIEKRLVKPWVNGLFMADRAVMHAQARYPAIALRMLEKYMKEGFNV